MATFFITIVPTLILKDGKHKISMRKNMQKSKMQTSYRVRRYINYSLVR